IPVELTVRILSAFSVSTFHSSIPSALSKSDFTFDTQPPQFSVVLNLRLLCSILFDFYLLIKLLYPKKKQTIYRSFFNDGGVQMAQILQRIILNYRVDGQM